MNVIFRMSRSLIVGGLLVSALAIGNTAFAGNGRFKNGVFEFCVSVRFDATAAELQKIRTAFENGSQILADATDGQHRFGKVILVNDSGASQSAEYWVNPGPGRAYATQGKYGVRGQHVNLYFDDDFQAIYGADGDAYTVAHEHAHHAYGVLDEYSGPNGVGDCAARGAPDPANLSFCLMDNYYIRGGNAGTGTTFTLNEFCVGANHDPDLDTWQEDINGVSCWDLISSHPTRSAAAPAGLPAGPPPSSQTVTFENGNGGLRVVLLLDRSGSMNLEQRIAFAKASASLFVDFVDVGDSVGVVSFASSSSVDFPLTEITGPATKTAAKAAIDAIFASGLTNIGGGLQSALNEILGQSDRSCNEIIVLLSDGDHNAGIPRPTVLPLLQDEGVTVISVGLGDGLSVPGEAELQNIATSTGGKFFRVRDSFELVGLFSKLSFEATGSGLLTERPLNVATGGFGSVGSTLEPDAESASFVIGIQDPLDMITYTLIDPGGTEITEALAATLPDVDFLATPNSQSYVVRTPSAGNWEQKVRGDNIQTGIFEALAFVGADGNQLNVSAENEALTFPEDAELSAELLYNGQRVLAATIGGTATAPSGAMVPVQLFDDGSPSNGDAIADDGIYSAILGGLSEEGTYVIDLVGESTAGVSTTFGGESHFPGSQPNSIPAPSFSRISDLSLVVMDVQPATYCTAKENSCGTVPMIGSTGTSSSVAGSGFIISAVNAPGPRPIGAPQNHELLYSLAGSQIRTFKGGILCLQNQVRRTIIRPNTGGSILGCDATMSFDMNEFAQVGPGNPDPGLKVPGNQVWVQFWGRDKPKGNIFLSDAMTYIVGP